MKGIILAGGLNSRLYPATEHITKHLLPIFDKPMIYYPLSVLMQSGINNILLVITGNNLPFYQSLLGNGSKFGINIQYVIQPKPDGLAAGVLLAKNFIGNSPFCLILGDNFFYGHGMCQKLGELNERVINSQRAIILGYSVKNPSNYGVVSLDEKKNIVSIEEKPAKPKSNCAVVGLYFFPSDATDIAVDLKPSLRGEIEITTLLQQYLKYDRLDFELLGQEITWFDAGTFETLHKASVFVKNIEKTKGLKIACPEEIAYRKKFIAKKKLAQSALKYKNTPYGAYLNKILVENNSS